jgi:hypothetical protein
VAASTRQGTLAAYSNFGPTVDIAVPGGDWANAIMALGVDQDGVNLNIQFGVGTSFSVPHVAGVGALYASMEEHRGKNNSYLMNLLIKGARKIDCIDSSCGKGILLTQNYWDFGIFSSETVIGAFGMLPVDYSRPGYIVNQNPNLYQIAHPDLYSFSTWKCQVGMYICGATFYWASLDWMLGIEYVCCKHSPAWANEGGGGTVHVGEPDSPGGSMMRYGAFTELRMSLTAFHYGQ